VKHLYNVPPSKDGIEQYRKHLEDGNQAIIVTYGKCLLLTRRNIDYVDLADGGFLIGYGKKKQFLFSGYLKLVEAGYSI
jgi:hypothetical protein